MNGRCHNDPMDFATDVCDSCGDQFCSSCLVFPRGNKKPPFCTHCAMALSGVRNRRPVKPLPRGEIKKRRKALRAQLANDPAGADIQLPGSDLIEAPQVEEQESAENDGGGLLGRFFRRKDDAGSPPAPELDEIAADLPAPTTTVVGGTEDMPPPPVPGDVDGTDEFDELQPAAQAPERTAAALLEQLKEQESNPDDDSVWLPPTVEDAPTWSLPDLQQSPLSSGPWAGVAAAPAVEELEQVPEPVPAPSMAEAGGAPMFVSEAELRAEGPADTDNSGNWVPPTLRGMAPQAQSNGDELPRRRRRAE